MGTYETTIARESAIRRLTWMAKFLDNAIVIPGLKFRVGYDAIIGLVPVAGDIVTTAMSLYVVYEAHRLGVRGVVIAKMLGNVVVDFLISEIPGVGDVIDIFFKSNTRNLALLGRELGIPDLASVGTGRLAAGTRPASQPPAGVAPESTPPADRVWDGADQPRKRVDNAAAC